jgi:hypothetical protein
VREKNVQSLVMHAGAYALAAIFLLSAIPGNAQDRPKKKLIEFGWDRPSPEFVRDHIRAMETRPFDGIVFPLSKHDHAFDTRTWAEAEFRPEMDALAAIKWERFSDNFLLLYSANLWKMDWFDDAQWKVIEANMRLFSRAGKMGKCVGVCFDNEPYGTDPWEYTGRYPGKSFDEVAAKVRIRGAQFMRALQSSMPGIKVLHFFQLGYYGDTSEETKTYRKEARPNLLYEPDNAVRTRELSERWLALFHPFFIGMLEAAEPGAVFIDGNEFAYYYDSPDDFYRHYHETKQSALTLVPGDLRAKYSAQAQAGNAVYFDILATADWGSDREPIPSFVPSNFITSEERLNFLEHNVYYSLDAADEYVWFYSQHINWWRDIVPPDKAFGPKEGLPPEVERSLVSASGKIARGKPLGFDIGESVARGWEKAEKAYEESKAKK